MESLARSLDEIDGGAALDIDELAVLLRGLGEYKGRASGDYGRFLQLWTGAPWSFTRVGAGGKPKNAINLHIPQPTLTIVGGLQPQLHELLGGEEDGMRPRWLPFLATMPDAKRGRARDRMPTGWRHLIDELLSARMRERTWSLSDAAIDAFWSHRERWKRQAQKLEPSSTAAALVKADMHLARFTLTIAEAEHPAVGGETQRRRLRARPRLWNSRSTVGAHFPSKPDSRSRAATNASIRELTV